MFCWNKVDQNCEDERDAMSVTVAIYPLNIFRYLPRMISLRHIVTMMMMIWMQISIVYGHFDLWPSSEGKWCLLHMITPSLLLYTCFMFLDVHCTVFKKTYMGGGCSI